MRDEVKKEIETINKFETIDELHDYIKNELDLDNYTYDEFLIIWKHMNLCKF